MFHIAVLSEEVIRFLNCRAGKNFIDANVGTGGHSELILSETAPEGVVVGFEWDARAAGIAKERLRKYSERFRVIDKNFSSIGLAPKKGGVEKFDGIVYDLGPSSLQLDDPGRGFSFLKNGPLDMRMDNRRRVSARQVVNEFDKKEISRILRIYGEERFASRIASKIAKERDRGPIDTTSQLASIIKEAIPRKFQPSKIHPATKSFMALRIFVNDELENLKVSLEGSLKILKRGARIVVISFHSLEDRIVKRFMNDLLGKCRCPKELPECLCNSKAQLKVLTKRPVTPDEDEIAKNPRSRSAKLRAAEVL